MGRGARSRDAVGCGSKIAPWLVVPSPAFEVPRSPGWCDGIAPYDDGRHARIMSNPPSKQSLWGGRFEGASDPLFRQFNDSLPFDVALLRQDVEGSIAWAHALERAEVLTPDEVASLAAALSDVLAEGERDLAAVRASGAEDVHSWVETQLVNRVGPLGRKLHTGRSRNDQVATDLRLWTRDAIAARRREIVDAAASLVDFARRELGTIVPGMTHLQHGQPVLLSHWALA